MEEITNPLRGTNTLRAQFRHLGIQLRKFARRVFGFRSIVLARWILRNPTELPSFGVNQLDLKIIQAVQDHPKYYVEIGANDGVSQSNTLTLELFLGWKGILIEPASSTYRLLLGNRSRRRNKLARAACVSFDYSGENVELLYANLMSIVKGIDSDVDDIVKHAKDGEKFLPPGAAITSELVPALTMNSILQAAKAPQSIGLLSLDVEGAELEVLQGIRFDEYQFHAIVVESRSIDRIEAFLAEQGYALQQALSDHDYLFQPIKASKAGA